MIDSWFIKSRVEYPLLISVFATYLYSVGVPQFLFFDLNTSILISLLISILGVFVHISSPSIAWLDRFVGRNYVVLGDFLLWLGIAIFSGTLYILLFYIFIFLLRNFRLIVAKNDDRADMKKSRHVRRDMNSLVLLIAFMLYLSGLNSYLTSDSFSASVSLKIIFLLYLLFYITVRNLASSKKRNQNLA